MLIKNRGSSSNPEGRFEKEICEKFEDDWYSQDEENFSTLETTLLPEKAKTIISHNDSPDVGFEQSINPYRGCEHGCIYCYARPSHAYMNMSPGLDFETKIFYKVDAAKLLEKELRKTKYICKPIVLGGNTDPYQPIESKLKITRRLLEILNEYNHPVAVITKSSLIERDMDLLTAMAQRRLAKVAISITTLSSKLKRTFEPRTSTPQARLRTVNQLSNAGIPVRVMVAPVIPLINDMELEKILELSSQAGARHASYVFIRLPYEVKELFKEWLMTHYPERAEHVISLIKQTRNGKIYDSNFKNRMTGEGEFATLIKKRFYLACKRFKLNCQPSFTYDTKSFQIPNFHSHQLNLWD